MNLATVTELWKRHGLMWVVPLVLVLVNISVLSTYRALYSGRVEAIKNQADQEEQGELADMRSQRVQLERIVERARNSRDGIGELYDNVFATESERFTRVVREVKELAERAGLRPDSIGYPERSIEEHDLIKRSIVFTVAGSYGDLRRFINFLELSDHFVALEKVEVQQGAPQLTIALELATLFSGRDRDQEVASL